MIAGGRTLTDGALAREVNRLAHGLRAAGLDRGDRVLLRLPNVPEFLVSERYILRKADVVPYDPDHPAR
jgi:non-ribosomal peptide synthetase component E (peptide arylation enzyme)